VSPEEAVSARNDPDPHLDGRVLVQSPAERDEKAARILFGQAGIPCVFTSDPARLREELEAGAGALVVAEEFLLGEGRETIRWWLAEQPPWSDLPVIVLAKPRTEPAAVVRILDVAGNATVLERPTRSATLVSSVRTALRGRQKQYQIRGYIAERERSEELLRTSDRRKDEFLAVLAHELRNPLAPIRNAIQLLRLRGTDAGMVAQASEMMERQFGLLVRLVDDLMEVSRISRGKIDLRRQPIDIGVVVRSAVEASRPLFDAAGHALETNLPASPLVIEADPARLAQVLANLLNNAAKYTKPGGRIRLDVGLEGDEAVLRVRDDGIGIPREMLSRIFEMFTQVDGSKMRHQGGLGIGLTLVKQLVEMHGGSVEARSDGPDRGSEFVVRLPVRAGEVLADREIRPMPPFRKHRILVVDDNLDSADSLGLLLRTLGAEVRVAYDGNSALEVLDAFRPEAMLLDLAMPGMDGHEVARRVRERADRRDLVLVALTGFGREEDVERTRASGFDEHCVKPVDLARLKQLLESLDADGVRRLRTEPLVR
jgi:signal transduction histidine kinase/ActR/RegA family two-component response regulator